MREEIVKQAEAWLGKKESNGSHKEIIDVYNAHKPLARSYKVKYTDAWCATFVSAVAIKCGATDVIPTECSCQKMINLFKGLGTFIEKDDYTPSPGDIIFYDWDDSGKGDNKGNADHVGIVQKVSSKTIYVIEGNYSNSVKVRKIAVNAKYIRGFASPNYPKRTTLQVGDKVKLISGSTYYSGKKIPSWVFKKTLYVRQIKGDKVIVSWLKIGAITGTVHIKSLTKI